MATEPSALPEFTNYLITALVAIGTTIGAAIAYLKKPKEASVSSEVAVVSAALFSDKRLIQELVTALEKNTEGLHEHRKCLDELNELVKTDIQNRHDEQIIRAALAKHGITHTS